MRFVFSILSLIWLCPGLLLGAELSLAEKKAAKQLYEVKCAKCHKFYDPARYSDADWEVWMGKMERKAKLKPGQKELLRKYINSELRPKRSSER